MASRNRQSAEERVRLSLKETITDLCEAEDAKNLMDNVKEVIQLEAIKIKDNVLLGMEKAEYKLEKAVDAIFTKLDSISESPVKQIEEKLIE
jgi:hypothetical protein